MTRTTPAGGAPVDDDDWERRAVRIADALNTANGELEKLIAAIRERRRFEEQQGGGVHAR